MIVPVAVAHVGCAVTLAVGVLIAVGCVIIKLRVVVQEFASVTVQVHDPAVNPVTEVVPLPVGVPGVQL